MEGQYSDLGSQPSSIIYTTSMRLTDFLYNVTDRQVQYYPALRPILGSATATIFFCQLLYWTGRQADPEGWIYKSQSELEGETALTREEQEGARAKLRDRGILQERRRGIPCRLWYRLDLERVNQLWELHGGQKNQENPQCGQLPQTRMRGSRKQERVIRSDKDAANPHATTLDHSSDDQKTTTSPEDKIDPHLLQDIVAGSRFADLNPQSLQGCVADYGAAQTLQAIDYCVWSRKAPAQNDPANYIYGTLKRGLSISSKFIPFASRKGVRKKHQAIEQTNENTVATSIWESLSTEDKNMQIQAVKREQPALQGHNGIIVIKAAMQRAERSRGNINSLTSLANGEGQQPPCAVPGEH